MDLLGYGGVHSLAPVRTTMSNFDPKDPDDWKGLGIVILIGVVVFSLGFVAPPHK